MADEEVAPSTGTDSTNEPTKLGLKLVARDRDSAPSLWPDTIAVDDAYKDRIRDGMAIVLAKIKETKKLYMDAAERRVNHRVKGAVMLMASDLLDIYERYTRGEREFGINMGWFTAYDAQQCCEYWLVDKIASAELDGERVLVMVLHDNLVTTSIHDVPYGIAYVS